MNLGLSLLVPMLKNPPQSNLSLPQKLILEEVAVESAGRFSSPQGDPSEKRLKALDPETGHAWGFVVKTSAIHAAIWGWKRSAVFQ